MNFCGIANKSYPAFLVGKPRATRDATVVTTQTAKTAFIEGTTLTKINALFTTTKSVLSGGEQA